MKKLIIRFLKMLLRQLDTSDVIKARLAHKQEGGKDGRL